MAGYDNTYSRLVGLLKILLPLIALAILSTLFLVSQRADPDRAIPYSEVEVAAILREQRIDRPDYASVTSDGTAITIAAESARPDATDRVSASTLRARLETPDGGILSLEAETGMINTSGARADLSGGVRIATSTGYVIDTEQISAMFDTTGLETAGEIRATGPLGTLRAGTMQLTRLPATAAQKAAYVLVFKKGVHLLYQPKPNQGGRQ